VLSTSGTKEMHLQAKEVEVGCPKIMAVVVTS
jgi:hypothetical protein